MGSSFGWSVVVLVVFVEDDRGWSGTPEDRAGDRVVARASATTGEGGAVGCLPLVPAGACGDLCGGNDGGEGDDDDGAVEAAGSSAWTATRAGSIALPLAKEPCSGAMLCGCGGGVAVFASKRRCLCVRVARWVFGCVLVRGCVWDGCLWAGYVCVRDGLGNGLGSGRRQVGAKISDWYEI